MLSKAEIRNAGLKRRDGTEPQVREQFASRLAALGPQLVREFAPVGEPTVACYSAIGSEPDPLPLVQALHASGVPLALPVDWSSGTPLVYRRWLPGDPLAVGPLGIAEPLEMAAACEPDVLFIPLAAFDRRGHRVGYGAGNVDRTLEALRSRRRLFAIGVAFAVQEEPSVPSEPHDQPLDIIMTEREIVNCRT